MDVLSQLEQDLYQAELDTKPGEWAEIRIALEQYPPQDMLDNLYYGILETGHAISPLTVEMINDYPTVCFKIRRDLPLEQYLWPLLIPLLVPLATIGIWAYGISQGKSLSESISSVFSSALPLIAVGGGLLVLILISGSKTANAYIDYKTKSIKK